MKRTLLLCLALTSAAPARARADGPKPHDVPTCIAAHERGQLQRQRGDLVEAERTFASCAAAACPQTVAVECASLRDEVSGVLPSLIVTARLSSGEDLVDARVFIDGQLAKERLDGRPSPANPGEHVIRVTAASGIDVERRFLLRQGEKERLIAFEGLAAPGTPRPDAEPRRRPALIAAGVATVATAAFVGFGLTGRWQESQLNECKPFCSPDDVHAMRRWYGIADGALLVAVAAWSTAAWLWWRPSASRPVETTALVQPDGTLGINVRGRF